MTEKEKEQCFQGLEGEAKEKLLAWLKEMEPYDYDAPGYNTREQGV